MKITWRSILLKLLRYKNRVVSGFYRFFCQPINLLVRKKEQKAVNKCKWLKCKFYILVFSYKKWVWSWAFAKTGIATWNAWYTSYYGPGQSSVVYRIDRAYKLTWMRLTTWEAKERTGLLYRGRYYGIYYDLVLTRERIKMLLKLRKMPWITQLNSQIKKIISQKWP